MKPEFFTHHDLFSAEKEFKLPLRVAFAGLWTVADRAGRFTWKPIEIKLACLPYDDVDFSRVLDALESRGFILKYAQGKLGAIPSFSRHQFINNKERESSIPPPTQEEIDAWVTRNNRVTEVLFLDQGEGKGREGKEKRKGKEQASSTPEGFEAWYADYPRKQKRQDAEDAWRDLNPDADLQAEMRSCLPAQIKGNEWWKEDKKQFIPLPASWIRAKRWTDRFESGRRQEDKKIIRSMDDL